MSNKIIMFTGPSCAACKTMKPFAINRKAEIIDVTEQPMEAQKYGIRGGLPVFIKLDENGDFKDRIQGTLSESAFIRWSLH